MHLTQRKRAVRGGRRGVLYISQLIDGYAVCCGEMIGIAGSLENRNSGLLPMLVINERPEFVITTPSY
jgi:hypothetical protein